ncbi:MAG: hypothetical protein JF593_11670 [Novosphingobium sp.]|nr:hypothetical protein [Novosphingobium sp.]
MRKLLIVCVGLAGVVLTSGPALAQRDYPVCAYRGQDECQQPWDDGAPAYRGYYHARYHRHHVVHHYAYRYHPRYHHRHHYRH